MHHQFLSCALFEYYKHLSITRKVRDWQALFGETQKQEEFLILELFCHIIHCQVQDLELDLPEQLELIGQGAQVH